MKRSESSIQVLRGTLLKKSKKIIQLCFVNRHIPAGMYGASPSARLWRPMGVRGWDTMFFSYLALLGCGALKKETELEN
jgi:CII-binding regulator of phage lambda lysogenization HflD